MHLCREASNGMLLSIS
jgi:hypothetical protein